jgi:hypothetical protein
VTPEREVDGMAALRIVERDVVLSGHDPAHASHGEA